MKYIRTILALLLTIFCGAGAGIILTYSESSLVGTILYTAFPFAVAVLFIAIGLDVVNEMKSETVQPEVKVSPPVEVQVSLTGHHPKPA